MEANLFVAANVIKICFRESFGGTANNDAISLKYTIDYPKIELHPFDTQRFKLYYSDDKIDAKYDFDKCIELKALSRQSRDLIALAIKSFSAHTYYINSKIISDVRNSSFMVQINTSEKREQQGETNVSELLLELEFVKRELYSQINYSKELERGKQKLKDHLRKMEDEMQVTI